MSKNYDFAAVSRHHLQLERLRERLEVYEDEAKLLRRKADTVLKLMVSLKKKAPAGADAQDKL